MPFMVIYRTSDGAPCYEQADAIDEAALFVERLRNQDGIDDHIRIYRMEEISFAFRPYYKVELGLPEKQTAGTPPSEIAPARPAADDAPRDDTDAPAAVTPVAADEDLPADLPGVDGDATNGRRGLFGR